MARRLAALICLFFLAGCLTPEKAERAADEAAVALATSYWREQTGVTNAFDLTRPAEALAFQVALAAVHQGVTNAVFPRVRARDSLAVDSNGLVRISLMDALTIGARHNRKYRTLKETVYTRALALDTERHNFETTFSGMILGALAGNPELVKETASAGGDSALAKRKFEQGAVMTGNMAVDVARMVRDDWHSFAWTGDLTMSVPLMRGAGRQIVREALTQAERNLAYALLTFDRYRQTYALSVAKAYFNVLEYAQNNRNSQDNAKRLEQNYDRAEMMFKAGRMDRIQMDQARTDLLTARQSIITTRQSYQDALDNFKITLGLAPEMPLALKADELRALESRMSNLASATSDALAAYPAEEVALVTAVSNRQDLAVARGDLADAERQVIVKADALRADLTLEGGAQYKGTRRSHEDGNVDDETETDLKVKFSAPWDRRKERNAYRQALITRDQAQRSYTEDEDGVKNEVRAGYRDLESAYALYGNKAEALKVAQMRVNSNDLFMQSGRSSMRDILEAESALLSARNSLCSAVIDWWTSDLTLKTAMGILPVSEEKLAVR